MSMPRLEWRGRADFAEYAEAVACETDEVLSAAEKGGVAAVLYSPGVGGLRKYEELDPDTMILKAILRRDDDGVLRVDETGEAGTLGEFMAQVEGKMLG